MSATSTTSAGTFLSHLLNQLQLTGSPFSQQLQGINLPDTKNEEYKHTRLSQFLNRAGEFELQLAPPVAISSFPQIDIDALVITLVNGYFIPEKSSSDLSSFGIKITNRIIGDNHSAELDADGFKALNEILWTNQIEINVPAGVKLSKPVIIYNVGSTSTKGIAAFTKLKIELSKEAELQVIENLLSNGSSPYFSSMVQETSVAEGAGYQYYLIQNDPNRFQFNHTQITQKDSSRVNTYAFTLDGKVIRNNLQLKLDGRLIESHMYGLYLLQGSTLADNHTMADHMQPDSVSNELYKGIMDHQARGVFNGKIYVRPQAQKTNAFQTNRNIILTDTAGVNTKPQLEIWADDVKCSHGCTTGQLDSEGLFYMRSRGIDARTARAMMLYAFAAEVLECVANDQLKAWLDVLVRTRLHQPLNS